MSEDKTHGDGEQLFDTKPDDAATDAANDTEGTEESTDGEQEQDTLDLDDKSTASKAEEAKQNQINAWQRKLDEGKATNTDLPDNLSWLASHLTEPKAKESAPDIDAIVERKIAEKADLQKFMEMKAGLSELNLTNAQKKELESEFKDLRSSGLKQTKALEKAMRLAGVDPSGQKMQQLKEKMSMPKESYYSVGLAGEKVPSPGTEAFDKLNPDERVKALERIRTKK